MIWGALWPFYIAIPIIVAAALIIDYRTLPVAKGLDLALVSDHAVELGSHSTVRWRLQAGDQRVFAIPGWEIKIPRNDTMYFFPDKIGPKKEYDESGELMFVFSTRGRADQLSRNHKNRIHIRSASILQLWGRTFVLGGNRLLPHVVPEHQKVPEQMFERAMKDNRSLFMGARVRVRHGAPDQFHSHRPYRHGDPLRFLDHKKTARYGSLVTKTFDTLVDQTIIIGCDLGRSMSGRINGSEKLSFYREAIYHLVENAITSRDKVGFFGFAGRPEIMIPPTRDLNAFRPLIDGDDRLRVYPEESQYDVVPQTVSRLASGRCVFVLFSDLSRPSVQTSLLPQIRMIAHRHLSMVLGLVDTNVDIDEQILELPSDYHEGTHAELLYGYWLRNQFDVFNRQVSQLGAGVVTVPERYWMDMTTRIYQTLRTSVLAG